MHIQHINNIHIQHIFNIFLYAYCVYYKCSILLCQNLGLFSYLFAFDGHILHIMQTVLDYAEYMLCCNNIIYIYIAANYAYYFAYFACCYAY